MPEWLLDKNVQGLIGLVLLGIAGVWAFFKFHFSQKQVPIVTKLEIKYPDEKIEERLTRIEGMLMSLLHETRTNNTNDEISFVTQHILNKAKSSNARKTVEGVEIKLTAKNIESMTYVKENIVIKTLSMLENEGLIRINDDYITVFSEEQA